MRATLAALALLAIINHAAALTCGTPSVAFGRLRADCSGTAYVNLPAVDF